MSVWGVSVVAILDCSLNVYACGQQKALTMLACCIAANCNNSQATQSKLCTSSCGINPLWGENGSNLYNSNELSLMLHLSHAHLCSKQSVKQTADTKWKKQNSWNHLKIPNGCLPASIRWKKKRTKKTLPNHNSLIDYCLQQRSGRLQSEEHRAKITVPTTNRWKAKLTITNSKPFTNPASI